jgi:mannosyl-oligosaccharide glucosidase
MILFFAQLFSVLLSCVAEPSPEFISAISAASNASLLWGPYRSNLYFGVRPRLPNSLLTGLLWSNVDDFQSFPSMIPFFKVDLELRHSCEMGDDMASFGWTEYDGRFGGKQNLSDRGMKIDLETEFVKIPDQNGLSFLDLLIRWELGSSYSWKAKG